MLELIKSRSNCLRVKVRTSYSLAASLDLVQYKYCIKRVVFVLIVFISSKKVPLSLIRCTLR